MTRLLPVLFLCLITAMPSRAAEKADVSTAGRAARQTELDAITRDIAVSEERRNELRLEIAALEKDRAALNQSLLDTSKRAQTLEGAVGKTERRLQGLASNEQKVRASLSARRNVLAEVLAALQRMGRRPPPAILVRPEDALASVRSAILLGAVIPELRDAADKLAVDLRSLVAVRSDIEREQRRLKVDATALADERARIELLLAEKRDQRLASAEELANEDARAATLARQATGLKDLIARMESEVAAVATASAAADKADAENAKPTGKARVRPASLGAADRLTPSVAFADARGLLPRPVNGATLKEFGESDGLGARTQGVSLSTRSGATVNAPADGWVVYAGPFRSYGQLLIINAGGGYHVLMAGMERIDVQLGQFVLAGEPVAAMATPRLASSGAADIGSTQPVLYIEFRKDGNSIDPAPWWASSSDEKVGG
ncbi:MAG: peptidoglycan DD-metalloendopeptidase family protein [Bauldia sp.]